MTSYQPQLKSGVDLQLQTAFSEGNWSVVARLADKRARTLKDQYYEIVKLAAESQLGSPLEKAAAVAYVRKLVKDGTPVKDVEALELLEWACQDMMPESFFAETFGPLRVRIVKATPKDKVGAIDCLESCLLHWDLPSAQQVALILDKTFPQDHGLFFWNIITTYLYAMSYQCPEKTKAIYKQLPFKLIEKAARSAEQALKDGKEDMPLRAIRSEEEMLLFFDMLDAHGDIALMKEFLGGPLLDPVRQLRLGCKDILHKALATLSKAGEWQMAYSIAKQCLLEKDGNGKPSLLASDWKVWKVLVEAAIHVVGTDANVIDEVSQLLNAHLSVEQLRGIYMRTLMLAKVLVAFELGDIADPGMTLKPAGSGRVAAVVEFIESQYDKPSCFDDVKGYVEKLGVPELNHLLHEVLPTMIEGSSGYKAISLQTLSCKLRYLVLTTLQGMSLGNPSQNSKSSVDDRLSAISAEALRLYKTLQVSTADDKETQLAQEDFLPDLAIVASTALLKTSGICSPNPTIKPLKTSYRPVLLAITILEHQLLSTPKHSGVLLLLSRLHQTLGCARRAADHFATLEVKRTIVDSHGPLFFDRLSGVTPEMASGGMLASVVQSHYYNSLRLRMPRKLAEAFDAEAYSSVLQIPAHTESLRRSCTMVMGYVEEARGQRAIRSRAGEGLAASMMAEITDDTFLSAKVDYGSFPNLESSLQPPLHELLSLGPDPSNTRSHLSILAEQYFALLTYKPPAPYKPSNPGTSSVTDHTLVLESLSRIRNSLARFLHDRSAAHALTRHERIYYAVLSQLASLTLDAVSATRSSPPVESLQPLMDSVLESLDLLLDITALSFGSEKPSPQDTLRALSSFVPLSYLRDAASAARAAAGYITSFHDRQTSRDRSGETGLRKEVLAGTKALDSAAKDALKEASGWIADLRKEVGKATFVEEIARFIINGDNDGLDEDLEGALRGVIRAEGDGEVNIWAKKAVVSWRANVDGWVQVKWE